MGTCRVLEVGSPRDGLSFGATWASTPIAMNCWNICKATFMIAVQRQVSSACSCAASAPPHPAPPIRLPQRARLQPTAVILEEKQMACSTKYRLASRFTDRAWPTVQWQPSGQSSGVAEASR